MSKLIILRGLPAAGKSQKSAELLAEYGNAVRINRDLLRTMLHFDVWTGRKERITKKASRALAKALLEDVGVLLIDDCNLHQGTVESWRQLAREHDATFEIIRLDTSLEECLYRDAIREKPVGRHVIIGMAMQYGLFPTPAKGFVLCDLDGTLCNIEHRLHYVRQEPKDWDAFFSAIPNDITRADVLGIIEGYALEGYQIVFVSGRPDNYRQPTELWLSQTFPHYVTILMRRAGDHRPDTAVKEEILRTYFPDQSWIHCAIDDRPAVIRDVWKKHGIRCIDVGNGVEF